MPEVAPVPLGPATPVIVDPISIVNLVPQVSPVLAPHKLLMFECVLATKAQRVLETGTDVGDSGRIFATALRRTGGALYTVDKRTDLNYSWLQEYPNVTALRGDCLQLQWKDPIDVLHLDAGTTKEHVVGELRRFGPWVKQGGYILVHNTVHPQHGGAVTEGLRAWCREVGLRWSEDPVPFGMGIVEVYRDLSAAREMPAS